MGRRTKSIVPITNELLKPRVIDPKIVQQELKQNKLKQKHYYDVHTKSLSKLQVGDNVLMQMKGKWRPAKVISVRRDTPRSYDITTPEGQTYRRNRRHLKKVCKNSDQESYLSDDKFPAEINLAQTSDDTRIEDESHSTVRASSSPVTLRRSQRQIRKPARYCDLYM